MAFSQVDPASLDGEALQRWYLRSPLDLQREKLAAANQRYDDFMGGFDPDGRPPRFAGQDIPVPSEDVDRGARTVGDVDTLGSAKVQLAANNPTCVLCHGTGFQPPLLQGRPALRDGQTSAPSKPPERDRKQCEMQDRRDRQICAQQPTNAATAVCHQTASDRYSHCLLTGEVSTPKLFTIPGYSGR